MTIQELKALREEAEKDVANILIWFEEKTGVEIKDLRFYPATEIIMTDGKRIKAINLTCDIDIKL